MGMGDEDHAEYEDYQIDVQEKWDIPKKNVSNREATCHRPSIHA